MHRHYHTYVTFLLLFGRCLTEYSGIAVYRHQITRADWPYLADFRRPGRTALLAVRLEKERYSHHILLGASPVRMRAISRPSRTL